MSALGATQVEDGPRDRPSRGLCRARRAEVRCGSSTAPPRWPAALSRARSGTGATCSPVPATICARIYDRRRRHDHWCRCHHGRRCIRRGIDRRGGIDRGRGIDHRRRRDDTMHESGGCSRRPNYACSQAEPTVAVTMVISAVVPWSVPPAMVTPSAVMPRSEPVRKHT